MPPFAKQEAGDAARLGRELEAPRFLGPDAAHLGHHRDEGRAAQPLLRRPQEVGPRASMRHDEAGGVDPEGGKARAVELGTGRAPQNGPRPAREPRDPDEQGGRETGGGAASSLSHDLVHAAERQPPSREDAIDRGHTQRRRLGAGTPPAAALQGRDTGAQLLQNGLPGPQGHDGLAIDFRQFFWRSKKRVCSCFVLSLPRPGSQGRAIRLAKLLAAIRTVFPGGFPPAGREDAPRDTREPAVRPGPVLWGVARIPRNGALEPR
jgi:hypothetical protein